MRAILRGFVAGAILSCLRVPLGIDVCQAPAVDAKVAYGWRAAAIAAIAIGLFASRQAALTARFLLGAALGFGVHGFLFANDWSPAGIATLAATAILGAAALAAIRSPHPEDMDSPRPPPMLEMLGLAAAGAGATLAIEGIARHARLFGAGLAQDDTVATWMFLAAAAVGAASLGRLGARGPLRGLGLPLSLAAAAAACFLSLKIASRLSVPADLAAFLERFGLAPALHGTLAYDALISGALFLAPGLLVGSALTAAGGQKRLFSALVGSALGLVLVPGLLAAAPGATAKDAQPSSAELLSIGCLVAGAGAVLAILALSDRGAIARWSGIAASAAAASTALLVRADPVHVLSPWMPHPTFPLYVADSPEGQLTVESFGLLGGSWLFVTVDRRRVTPEFDGAVADALRLRASVDLVPEDKRARGKLSVLLVGQLTPERSRILAEAGVGRVDRTAAWSPSMPAIEDALWGALPETLAKPAGEIVDRAEARARIARGAYDLVVATAVPGDAPGGTPSGAPATTTVARWIDLDGPLPRSGLGGRAALMLDGLERPALAVVENAAETSQDPFAAILVRTGSAPRAPAPLVWLRRPEASRIVTARATALARLAAAESGSPLEDLTAGLALYFAAASETAGGRVELPEACMERFRAAALARTPDPTTRRTWETIAQVLSVQRQVGEIRTYVKPVAEKHGPWPELEKALARADLESSEPQAALRRLEPLRVSSPRDFEVWFLLGEAQCAAGDASAALESWRAALSLPTQDRTSRRKVALALVRSGDPLGREAAQRMLQESPDDRELAEALAQAPVEPPPGPCSP